MKLILGMFIGAASLLIGQWAGDYYTKKHEYVKVRNDVGSRQSDSLSNDAMWKGIREQSNYRMQLEHMRYMHLFFETRDSTYYAIAETMARISQNE